MVVHQAAKNKEPAEDGEQERAGGTRARRDSADDACSICGARSHTEYFCAYNYMDGCLSVRACREQCSSSSPGRHAMAAQDSLRRFVRVTNVPSSLGDRELRRLFQRFGPLRKCVVSRAAPEGGAGFGFVTFDNRGDAEEAVNELNGHRVGDRTLRVDWAYPRAHQA
ncbi:unnamed protein product [Urochloa decumbens]|uniref:RRM domain-containing protein n=1 Tax=Urochloa decumbens TaxID=240449 RepID=A0ABC9FCN4_9POAL